MTTLARRSGVKFASRALRHRLVSNWFRISSTKTASIYNGIATTKSATKTLVALLIQFIITFKIHIFLVLFFLSFRLPGQLDVCCGLGGRPFCVSQYFHILCFVIAVEAPMEPCYRLIILIIQYRNNRRNEMERGKGKKVD